ncbi:MAG TPA: hypothetical protein VLE19_03820 [Pyrinomonadaceae bacterium]|nr:hypothetical protein [Pyrinomonadaceae bacterium]
MQQKLSVFQAARALPTIEGTMRTSLILSPVYPAGFSGDLRWF